MSKPRIFLQMAENGGVFVGTYGSTPYSEIVKHFKKGDIICIKKISIMMMLEVLKLSSLIN